MARVVGTHFVQDDQLKTTVNISDMLVGLAAIKVAFSMEGVESNLLVLLAVMSPEETSHPGQAKRKARTPKGRAKGRSKGRG